jgi:hypothetical protein
MIELTKGMFPPVDETTLRAAHLTADRRAQNWTEPSVQLPSAAVHLVSRFQAGDLPSGWRYGSSIEPMAGERPDMRGELQQAGINLPTRATTVAPIPGEDLVAERRWKS